MDNIEDAVICDKCGEFVIPDSGKCPACGEEIDLSKAALDINFDGEDIIDDFEFDSNANFEDADDFVPSDDDVELDLSGDEFVGDDIDFSGLDDIDFGDADSDETDGDSGDDEIDF